MDRKMQIEQRRRTLLNRIYNSDAVKEFEDRSVPDNFYERRGFDDLLWVPVHKGIGIRLDHSWAFGYNGKNEEEEIWGFVNEPYLEHMGKEADNIIEKAANKFESWGIEILNLDKNWGSWNPPHCHVILARVNSDFSASKRWIKMLEYYIEYFNNEGFQL